MKANWLQKTVVAQEMITSVVNALAMGNMDEATAMTQLQSAPAPEVCDVIMAAYQFYPQGQMALDALGRNFGCNAVQQNQKQMNQMQQTPDVEKPMQMPSVEIE